MSIALEQSGRGRIDLPLCVDLNGTLVRSDLVHKALIRAFAPEHCLSLLPAALDAPGQSQYQRENSHKSDADAKRLPLHESTLPWLKSKKLVGRMLIRATASNKKYAHAVARHLKIFDSVKASNDSVNLPSSAKAQRLVNGFREGGFGYVGDSANDINSQNADATGAIIQEGNRI